MAAYGVSRAEFPTRIKTNKIQRTQTWEIRADDLPYSLYVPALQFEVVRMVPDSRSGIVPEQISLRAKTIKALAVPAKGIPPQGKLVLEAETEVQGVGMGVLSDGTPYLNQRGLASLCRVQNAHIGTISSQWNEPDQKPRIAAIKAILLKTGFTAEAAHIEIEHKGTTHYCYPAEICLAVLEYYAFDAALPLRSRARDNYRLLAGSKLREMIYSQVGYDPSYKHQDRFKHWHERLALNYQSAPKGYFHVFNEAHTIIYELIQAGANVGPNFVVDISIGQHWAKYWTDNALDNVHGKRCRYPHRYPDTHPQAQSNPQDSWCYPLAALGAYAKYIHRAREVP